MRILFVTTISNTINSFLVPHIKKLLSNGYIVDIATNVKVEINRELLELGCEIYDIKFNRSPFNKSNIKAYKTIKNLAYTKEYDVIHTHTPIASFLTRLACRKLKSTKIVYTSHGFHFYQGAPFSNWIIYYSLEKLVSKWTDIIVTINKEDFINAKKIMGKRKDSFVYMIPGIGVNLEKFAHRKNKFSRKQFGFNENDFLLIYAAELNQNKNQSFLIDCMYNLKTKHPQIKLLLAGDGSYKEIYKRQIEKLKLQENVFILGYRNDLDSLIPLCDLGVSASIREGLGINVVEYFACELPVIASKNRGHKELIQEGINGFLFRHEEKEKFEQLVLELYSSKENRLLMGSNALKTAEKFSIENSIYEMEKVYRVIENNKV